MKQFFLLIFVSFWILTADCGSSSSPSTSNSGNTNLSASILTLSPDGIFVGESTQITIRLILSSIDQTEEITQVTLISVDEGEESELGSMDDDGDPAHGDVLGQDGIYSTLVTFNEDQAGTIELKAKVETNDSTDTSLSTTLAVMNRLTDAEWNRLINTPVEAKAYYLALSGSEADKAISVAAYVSTLEGVARAEPSENGQGVWIVYENGLLGGVIFNEDDPIATTKGGGLKSRQPGSGRRPDNGNKLSHLSSIDGDLNAVQSKKALYLGPYLWQFAEADDYHGAWRKIQNSTCPPFATEEAANFAEGDQDVTPGDFKNLDQYGVVVISTHGDSWYNGLFTWWTDHFGSDADDPAEKNWLADELSVVIMSTGYDLTDENRIDYESDLQQHRMVVLSDGTLGITPLFIIQYTGSMPQSIVYLSSCRSLYNHSMAGAFITMGAEVVLGYSEYVLSSYAKDVGEKTFDASDGLLDFDPEAITVQEAHDAAVALYGESDGSDPPAFYELSGNTEANLDSAAITDGNFEQGNLAGWSTFGEYFASTKLGDLSPPEGETMGVITTYFGSSENIEVGGLSQIYQDICVPDGARTLSFQYNVVSEEPLCGNDSRFDSDSFYVRLYENSGLEADISPGLVESTDTSEWSFLGGDYFYQGDDFSTPGECHPEDNSRDDGTYQTGWKSVSLDVSPYAGSNQPLSLSFDASDGGDLIYDGVMLIDEVVLE